MDHGRKHCWSSGDTAWNAARHNWCMHTTETSQRGTMLNTRFRDQGARTRARIREKHSVMFADWDNARQYAKMTTHWHATSRLPFSFPVAQSAIFASDLSSALYVAHMTKLDSADVYGGYSRGDFFSQSQTHASAQQPRGDYSTTAQSTIIAESNPLRCT